MERRIVTSPLNELIIEGRESKVFCKTRVGERLEKGWVGAGLGR